MDYRDFRPPAAPIGTLVEFATSPTENERCLGFVTKTGKQFVSIAYFGSRRTETRRFCLHRSDPRCESMPEIFKDGDRGVWELADSEKRARLLDAKLAGLERMMQTMVDQIAVLQNPPDRSPTTSRRRIKEPVLTG